jgi:hypothetical protein
VWDYSALPGPGTEIDTWARFVLILCSTPPNFLSWLVDYPDIPWGQVVRMDKVVRMPVIRKLRKLSDKEMSKIVGGATGFEFAVTLAMAIVVPPVISTPAPKS